MTVIEPQPGRRATALEPRRGPHPGPGAAATWPRQARDLTGGDLFDVVIESAGHPAAMAQALTLAGNHGRIVYVGIDVGQTVPAELGLIQAKSLRIRGIVGLGGRSGRRRSGSWRPGSWTRVPIVTARYPLADATQALKAATPESGNIKVHIEVAPSEAAPSEVAR